MFRKTKRVSTIAKLTDGESIGIFAEEEYDGCIVVKPLEDGKNQEEYLALV